MISLCRYILQGGNPCTQAAIGGENYCRHHLVVRRTVAANQPRPNPYRIEKALPLVFPEDRAALQINLFLVMQGFNEGQIGPKSANIFAKLLHECAVNLKQGPLYGTDHENAVRRVVVTPEGEEIAPAREVPEAGDCASSETCFAQENKCEAVSDKTAGDDAISADGAVPSFAQDAREGSGAPNVPQEDDFGGCTDPCYIENLTQRREQYAAFALRELAAGRDPRDWDDFVPGKSRLGPGPKIPSLLS